MASGTGFCEVGGELLFLDLRRDRYLALRGEDRVTFDRLRSGATGDQRAMTRLAGSGLIVAGNGGRAIRATEIIVPEEDLSACSARSGSGWGTAFAAARGLIWARLAMRPARLARTAEYLAAAKADRAGAGKQSKAEDLAAGFAASRWLIPVAPRCLVDALALDWLLLREGVAATLVFGVRLNPFNAHCWLQTERAILTGTAAEARNFTPILTVG
ncbi:lasso peptide biosynthesis B2 protein [Sphingopyxis macrogoltabida]|uniref:lasso peptide biosynthesis B2 protein n=1 Tax=Sphingopyxis macrogoltabida TaxID=33050 RepID=UPI0006CF5BA3|nr:lasso peptide biosynthesis B2 protein [Sphingopyxis macrogoltabida]ALJ14062.1 hypothetical protein LH19_14405 [Sphingopyxis macrogoltabida]